jgi:hypothetical protein
MLLCEPAANILVFRDGTLVINDFGQAHIGQKRSSDSVTRDVPQTPGEQAYRPPENSDVAVMNQGYDDWAMGCVLLEILVYAACGSDGTKKLYEARGKGVYTDYYYQQTKEGKREFHPDVVQLLKDIDYDLTDVFFTAVLGIVKAMLMIGPKDRLNTEKACGKLQVVIQKARLAIDSGKGDSSLVVSPAPSAVGARQNTSSHDHRTDEMTYIHLFQSGRRHC